MEVYMGMKKYFLTFLLILFLSFPIINGFNSASALSGKVNPVGTNLIVEIAKNQNPAVVFVTSKTKFQPAKGNIPPNRNPFGQFGPFRGPGNPQPPAPGGGSGTGFIIDKEGYILTNHHVVDNADIIKITLDNEKEFEAELIGSDSKTDIALLKIIKQTGDISDFPYLLSINIFNFHKFTVYGFNFNSFFNMGNCSFIGINRSTIPT